MIEALLAAAAIAVTSVIGALFFGDKLHGHERYVVPVAVGVFLSLVFYELIPETLAAAPEKGGLAIIIGFVSFYILANILHRRFHDSQETDCDKKSAAMLILIGDGVHNIADGVILGTAFMVDPALGVATAVGLAIHQIPQEIVDFGLLVRGGYNRLQASIYNILSASSILIGVLLVYVMAHTAESYIWVVMGIAAGNLLFLATSELLPRIHGNLKNYGSIWHAATAIILGFIVMTAVLDWAHGHHDHGHHHGEHEEHLEDEHEEEEDHDEDDDHDDEAA